MVIPAVRVCAVVVVVMCGAFWSHRFSPPVTGDSMGRDADTFIDWSEQFELNTEACQ